MTGSRRSIRLAVTAAFIAVATFSLPSTPAQAQATHVAVVVDFGSQGGDSAHCARDNHTGYEVLDEGYAVKTNKTGLVTWINTVGNDNPPLDLYWSYWHNNGSGWKYASTGPATYTPAAGSLEGWVYGDGKSSPPSASYSSICAGKDPTTAPTHSVTPAPTHSSTHRTTQPPSTTSSHAGSTARGSTATARGSTPTSSPSGTGIAPTAKPAGTSSTGAPTSLSTNASNATAVAAANALPAAPPKASKTKRSGIPPWGTVLAIVVVAALGGAAFWRARAQRQQQP
jgi:hypothetical protein